MRHNAAILVVGTAVAAMLTPLLSAASARAQEPLILVAQSGAVENLYAKAFKRSCTVTICVDGLERICRGRRTSDGGCSRGGPCTFTHKRCHR